MVTSIKTETEVAIEVEVGEVFGRHELHRSNSLGRIRDTSIRDNIFEYHFVPGAAAAIGEIIDVPFERR